MRLRSGLGFAACLILTSVGRCDDVAEIITILGARGGQVANLDFSLTESRSPYEDGRRRAIEACKKTVALINSTFPSERSYVGTLEMDIRRLEKRYNEKYEYRVSMRDENQLCVHFNHGGRESTYDFYSGLWHQYTAEQANTKRAERLPMTGRLLIHKDFAGPAPHCLLALGPGPDGDRHASDVTSDLTDTSFALGYVPWTVFFGTLQKKEYKIEVLQMNNEILTLLIHRPTESRLGPGSFRYELDLYRRLGYCPAAFRSYQYIPSVGPKEAYFIGNAQCEWKNPVETNGVMLPSNYVGYGLQQFGIPSATTPFAYWKVEAIPTSMVTFLLGDVRVSTKPLQHPVAPPGTQVLDKVKGIGYVIGSAGEALEVTAIEAARDLLPGFKRTSTMMVLIYIAVGAAFLLIGFFAVRYYRRRRLV